MERHNRFWRVILLSPPFLVFGLFIVWPLFSSFYYSFTNWNGFDSNYDYVGFDNFNPRRDAVLRSRNGSTPQLAATASNTTTKNRWSEPDPDKT